MPGHHGQSGTSAGVSQGGSTGHTGHPSAGVGGNNNQPAETNEERAIRATRYYWFILYRWSR